MTCLLQTSGLEKGIVFAPSHCAAFDHQVSFCMGHYGNEGREHTVVKRFNVGKIPLVQSCLFIDGGNASIQCGLPNLIDSL